MTNTENTSEKEWKRRGYARVPTKPEDLDMDFGEFHRMIGAGIPTISVRTDEIEMLIDILLRQAREEEQNNCKKLLNSGKQMYELGKKEERERIVRIVGRMKRNNIMDSIQNTEGAFSPTEFDIEKEETYNQALSDLLTAIKLKELTQ